MVEQGQAFEKLSLLCFLHNLVLIEDLLVVGLCENKGNYLCVSHDCRRPPSRVKLINNSCMSNYCVCTKSGNTLIALFIFITIRCFFGHLCLCILLTENVYAALTAVNDIHAIADGPLVHQRLVFGEFLTF